MNGSGNEPSGRKKDDGGAEQGERARGQTRCTRWARWDLISAVGKSRVATIPHKQISGGGKKRAPRLGAPVGIFVRAAEFGHL